MPSEARQKKIMEKLNRAQKCSILGPQNLGSGGGPGPRGPPGSAPELASYRRKCSTTCLFLLRTSNSRTHCQNAIKVTGKKSLVAFYNMRFAIKIPRSEADR